MVCCMWCLVVSGGVVCGVVWCDVMFFYLFLKVFMNFLKTWS